jgi:hypothetical protein
MTENTSISLTLNSFDPARYEYAYYPDAIPGGNS